MKLASIIILMLIKAKVNTILYEWSKFAPERS